MKCMLALVMIVFSAHACQSSRDEAVPETSAPAPGAASTNEENVERANDVIRSLQSGLVEALTAAMKEGGSVKAVSVCRDEAQAITTRVEEEKGILVGRTSHRLRNPANAPQPWAREVVEQAAGKKTSDVEPHTIDLGDRIGVLKPINTLGLCTGCHGTDIDPGVGKALAAAFNE